MPLPNIRYRTAPNLSLFPNSRPFCAEFWFLKTPGGHKKAYFGQMGGLFYVKFQDLQLSYSMASVYLQNWRSFPHKNTFFCCFYVENFFSFEDRHLPLSKKVVALEILHGIHPSSITLCLMPGPWTAITQKFGKENSAKASLAVYAKSRSNKEPSPIWSHIQTNKISWL